MPVRLKINFVRTLFFFFPLIIICLKCFSGDLFRYFRLSVNSQEIGTSYLVSVLEEERSQVTLRAYAPTSAQHKITLKKSSKYQNFRSVLNPIGDLTSHTRSEVHDEASKNEWNRLMFGMAWRYWKHLIRELTKTN